MDKQDKNKPYTDIVVLDDSIIVRYVLRTFLHRFSKKLNIKFRIYTSADGVEGLGYLYITNPDVIIIDTTLPKYSGRELIEYLLNNNKFKIHGKRIVVIHEEDFDKDIPLNFVTIDKRDPKFLRKLFFEIIYAADTEKLLNEKFKGPLLRLGRSAVGLSAKADALIRHSDRAKSILLKPFYLIRWLFMQIIISINIFIVKLFTKEHTDDNISQRKRDLVFFRVRYYPTLLALLIGVVVLFVQVGVYFSSGLLLFKVSDRTVPAEAGFPEFRVQRGTLTDFGASEDIQTVTLANPVGSLSSAFVRITNTMNISGGPPSSTSDQEADDMGVTALLTDTSTITFTRLSSGVNKDQRVEWEVIEYTGEPGGDNEFIVRSHTSAQIVSATSSSVNISGLGISNIDRVVPFQSGVSSSVTSNGGEELAVYMYLSGSNLVLNKGDDDGTTTVSYALVEFTGSNWGVGHSNVLYSSTAVQDRSMYLGSLGGGGTTFDVGNWNNAFIEYQHSSSTGAQANISGRAWKGSNTSTIFFDLDDAATGIQAGMAHIVSNSNISVQWIDSHTLGTDATFSTSITAVDSMSRTSIFATATSDQTGTDYSRQSRNYQLTSTTQVDWWGHRSSSTIIGTVAVVQWSVLPDATVTVSSTGTQTSSISIPSTDSNLAAAFVLTTDNPDSLSSITIREQGTVNGQTELTNIKMYYENDTSAPYDCASESFGGGESQFGSTDADGFSGANGTATFTGTADFTSTSALCLYTSFDVPYNASAGRTIEIDIEDPSSDVTLAYGGTVSTGSTVQLAGTTTLTAPDSGCTPAAGYSVCKKLTISSDVVSGSSDLTNFPYLLSGTFGFLATVANGGSVANSNGYDIIFTSDNGGSTQMDHEIERYIGTTGEILFWIRIPTLDHDNDTEIYMHYGNAAVSTDPSSTGTWDSNFKMVQHLEEITSGATDFEDSTANGVDSTSVTIGADAESNPDVEGQVDGAVRLDGSNDQIEINDNTNLDITGALTISYWSKLDAQQSSDYGGVTKYASYTGFSNQRSYALTFGASTTRPEIFLSTAGTSLFSLQSSTSVGTTDWHHIAATYVPSTRVRIYIDGVLDAEDTTTIPTSLFDSTAPLWIGTMYDKTSSARYHNGYLDEVKISNSERSPDWITTEYNNQFNQNSYVSLGSAVSTEAESASFGSQISSVGTNTIENYIGGGFSVFSDENNSVASVTIREQGTVDAQTDLDAIKMYYELDTSTPYDCASESYSGTEAQYGSTDLDGFDGANGKATFTQNVSISPTSTLCLYPVMSIKSGGAVGETIEIDIENPSTDIAISGVMTTTSTLTISGTTTIADGCTPRSGYSFCRTISVDNTKVSGSTDLENFPMLFSGTYVFLRNTANGGDVENSNGYDIVFTPDINGAYLLDHEIEKYVSSSGESVFWIRIPDLISDSNSKIFIHYGNSSISSSQEDVNGVWDEDYLGVWHMSEDPSGSAPQLLDSTSGNNHGTSSGTMTTGDLVPGQIGDAIQFDGTDDYFSIANESNFDIITTSEHTVSTWIRVDAFDISWQTIVAKDPDFNFRLQRQEASNIIEWSSNFTRFGAANVNNGGWNYLFANADSSSNLLYTNGTADSSNTFGTTFTANNNNVNIGNAPGTSRFWEGYVDEVRISKVKRTADWGATEYNNYNDPSTFYILSNEDGDTSYQFTKSITIDADKISGSSNFSNYAFLFNSTIDDLRTTPNGGFIENSNGYDIIFTSDEAGTTKLDHEIESYHATTGGLVSWIRIPSLSYDSDTTIYMQYGNSSIISSQENTTAVWDTNYAMVQHLEESTTGATDFKDSTSNARDSSAVTFDGSGNANATTKVDGGVYFDGTNDQIQFDDWQTSGTATAEFWIKPDTNLSDRMIFGQQNIGLGDGGAVRISNGEIQVYNGLAWQATTSNAPITAQEWHYVAIVYNGTTAQTYINGLAYGSSNSGAFDFNGEVPILSKLDTFPRTQGFVDEFRISTITRSADRFITNYNNMYQPDCFYSIEGESTYCDTGTHQYHLDYDGMVSYWPMDEPTDGTCTGSLDVCDIKSGYNGDNTGTSVTGGYSNLGRNFDVSTDEVQIAGTSALKPTSKLTINLWAKWTGTINDELISMGDSYVIRAIDDDVQFFFYSGSYHSLTTSGQGLNDGNWHMITAVKEPNQIRIYKDGNYVTHVGNANTISYSLGNDLWFGAHGNGGGSLDDWLGDMDEVSFFDRALTDAEVKALFLDPVPNSAPTVTNVTLNSGNNISLVENIMFGVDWTATVTDLNGYPDISTVTGKVYRSGVAGAEACSTNEANCYEDVSCSLSACTGNSCTATCSANIQFFADATDASSSFPSEYWLSFVEATDFSAATGDNHSPNSVNELNTLLAHDVTGTLGYGSLVAGDDTGSSNDTLIVTNTGNSTIDTEISGTDLCTDFPTCSVNIIPVSNQEYSTSAFTYGAGTDLLSTNATIHLNLAKATAAPSNATFTTYWGIGLPSILNTGNYTGNTSFLVTAD